MHVVHFNVKEGLKEKIKRKIMERAEINVTENCRLSETLNIHSHANANTRRNTLTLSVLSNSVSPRLHGIFLSFIQHSSHFSSVVLITLGSCCQSAALCSIFFNHFCQKLYKCYNLSELPLLMSFFIQHEMESSSPITCDVH